MRCFLCGKRQIKPAREACEESKNELIRLGEDVSDLDEELDRAGNRGKGCKKSDQLPGI